MIEIYVHRLGDLWFGQYKFKAEIFCLAKTREYVIRRSRLRAVRKGPASIECPHKLQDLFVRGDVFQRTGVGFRFLTAPYECEEKEKWGEALQDFVFAITFHVKSVWSVLVGIVKLRVKYIFKKNN
jgi:hypothetical protein